MNEAQYRAIERTRLLKRAEAAFRATKGLNPAFPWSAWGDRPRACAIWTPKEIEVLHEGVKQLEDSVSDIKQRLSVASLCYLAWVHGRSASGVSEKLYQLLGYKEYYKRFDI